MDDTDDPDAGLMFDPIEEEHRCPLCLQVRRDLAADFCPHCGRYVHRGPTSALPTSELVVAGNPPLAKVRAWAAADAAACGVVIVESGDVRGVLLRFAPERMGVWSLAALNAVTEGRYLVGLRLLSGVAVEQDAVGAVGWLAQAAAQRMPDAEYALGLCLRDGVGVRPNPLAAARCFRDAAGAGHAFAASAYAKAVQTH